MAIACWEIGGMKPKIVTAIKAALKKEMAIRSSGEFKPDPLDLVVVKSDL